jgi:2-amino-4-hydroxy-6-hydroxymethyldihydropteridine diphosphokinase
VSEVTAYVSGGSNIAPEANLQRAARELKRRFPGARFSRCYRNKAVGFDGPDFINFAVALPTSLALQALDAELEAIEALCGRPAGAKRWEPRAMDLDVLLFGDAVGEFGRLKLPRPSLLEWGFMLGPLSEIAPDVLHPVQRQTIAALWANFDRTSNPLVPVALDLAAA